MRKRLTEEQFQNCLAVMEVGQTTIEIAYGVLVKGESQASFAEALGVSRAAVSQAVNRVWKTFKEHDLPSGHERVCAVLPGHRAFLVKKWAAEAEQKESKK